MISKSKLVEWLGQKLYWCGQEVNGWGVRKDVDNFFEMGKRLQLEEDIGFREDFFFFKKEIEYL